MSAVTGNRLDSRQVSRAPIAVALDAPDLDTALRWAAAVGPYVQVVKVGLELYLREGAPAVRAVGAASGCPVFLDLKLHDIPNTVAGAARAVADLAPAYLTVHAAGGSAMIAAAAQALPDTKVAAVTVLTSLSAADLAQIGLAGPPIDAVRRLAVLAVAAGARALVCSAQEVAAVRAEVGPDIVLITPGVRLAEPARPAGAADPADAADPASGAGGCVGLGDQARVATPERAIADGADLLVVGRPITAAGDPAHAAQVFAALAAAALPWRGPGH
jgi:orotidine-5'-phosphate decarboxylase